MKDKQSRHDPECSDHKPQGYEVPGNRGWTDLKLVTSEARVISERCGLVLDQTSADFLNPSDINNFGLGESLLPIWIGSKTSDEKPIRFPRRASNIVSSLDHNLPILEIIIIPLEFFLGTKPVGQERSRNDPISAFVTGLGRSHRVAAKEFKEE